MGKTQVTFLSCAIFFTICVAIGSTHFCSQGVDLLRVEFVPDDKDDIVSTVLRLKDKVGDNGVIFSSGGIGQSPEPMT